MNKIGLVVIALAGALAACSSERSSNETSPPPPPPPVNPYSSLMGVVVKDAKYNYDFIVVNPNKLANLINNSKKFVADGYLENRAVCTASNLDSKNLNEDNLRGRALTVFSNKESLENTAHGTMRTLSVKFNEWNLAFNCVKPNQTEDFTWLEVQKAFSGVVELRKIPNLDPQGTIESKIAIDADGYCVEELMEDSHKMLIRSLEFGRKAMSLGTLIMYAKSEEERLPYRIELSRTGRTQAKRCEEFEKTWGQFSCKTRSDDGSDGRMNDSRQFKKSCDHVRAMYE